MLPEIYVCVVPWVTFTTGAVFKKKCRFSKIGPDARCRRSFSRYCRVMAFVVAIAVLKTVTRPRSGAHAGAPPRHRVKVPTRIDKTLISAEADHPSARTSHLLYDAFAANELDAANLAVLIKVFDLTQFAGLEVVGIMGLGNHGIKILRFEVFLRVRSVSRR